MFGAEPPLCTWREKSRGLDIPPPRRPPCVESDAFTCCPLVGAQSGSSCGIAGGGATAGPPAPSLSRVSQASQAGARDPARVGVATPEGEAGAAGGRPYSPLPARTVSWPWAIRNGGLPSPTVSPRRPAVTGWPRSVPCFTARGLVVTYGVGQGCGAGRVCPWGELERCSPQRSTEGCRRRRSKSRWGGGCPLDVARG